MKRFITKITIFSILVYVLALGLDYMISRGLTNTYGHPFQAWKEMRSGDYPADIIIMGTSRALEHYDPHIMDSITGLQSFNLGMGGYSINIELMKYRYYLRYNPQPKYIIYDVDMILLTIDTAVHQHQSEQFLPLFWDGAIRKDLRNVGYSWIDAYIPMARYWGYQTQNKRGLFESLNLKHYYDYPSYKGYTADAVDWDPTRLFPKDSIYTRIDIDAINMFEAFVDECNTNGIQLIFVTSPVFYTTVEMAPDWNRYIAWYDSIAEANNIPYLNYMDHPICRDSTYFNAGVHLTPEGSKMFSIMLSNDLLEKQVIELVNNE